MWPFRMRRNYPDGVLEGEEQHLGSRTADEGWAGEGCTVPYTLMSPVWLHSRVTRGRLTETVGAADPSYPPTPVQALSDTLGLQNAP